MIHGGVLLQAWCEHVLDGLIEGGVRELVISPGSRSTPMVLAAQDRRDLQRVVVVDERSAAFYGLGRARATGQPVALLRTSGTASAHDLPAVIEASESGHPLVVISADRPHELMEARAPQTVDQTRLFGHHVRGFFELGTPDASELALRAARRVGCQVGALALGPRPGPVHVNLRARKPLEPPTELSDADARFLAAARRRLEEPAPRIYPPGPSAPSEAGFAAFSDELRSRRRPLVVAGPGPAWSESVRARMCADLARIGVPVLAEATSQLRLGPGGLGAPAHDLLLRNRDLRSELAPDVIIQLGEPPVSTGLQKALAEWEAPRWVISPWGAPDPNSRSRVLQAELPSFLQRWSADAVYVDPAYQARFASRTALAARLAESGAREWGEGRVTRLAREALPAGGRLMVGNSLAVRHLDQFVPNGGPPATVLHQRGAAGIDGLIAGAIAASRDAPTVLLLGDVSARHDVGSLQLRALAGDLRIVVLHNGGGRIFEQLPVAARLASDPERLDAFLTSSGDSLVPVARAFGWSAEAVADEAALREALTNDGPRYIEAHLPSTEASATLARLEAALERAKAET